MIPYCHDITDRGDAPDFLNLSILTQFFAQKCCVITCNRQKGAKKVTSNILQSSLKPTVKVIYYVEYE